MGSKYGHDSRPALPGKIGARDAEVARLTAERDEALSCARESAEIMRRQRDRLEAERDEALVEVERLRARLAAAERPISTSPAVRELDPGVIDELVAERDAAIAERDAILRWAIREIDLRWTGHPPAKGYQARMFPEVGAYWDTYEEAVRGIRLAAGLGDEVADADGEGRNTR